MTTFGTHVGGPLTTILEALILVRSPFAVCCQTDVVDSACRKKVADQPRGQTFLQRCANADRKVDYPERFLAFQRSVDQ